MASSAVLGALRIILGADTGDLESGLKSAAVKVGIFAGVSIAAGEAIGRTLGGAIRNVADAIPATINAMDQMAKQSQKIGIPVEQLSAFKLAADLSDVSMEQLGKGVAKLSKAMVESAAKPTSEAASAFKAIGVSAKNTDGSLKSTTDVVTEIAGKFEGLKDGAGKTAISMALFGKAGADLIPLLNSGSTGLAEMVVEARQLGLVISTETAKSAEAFNDNLRRLGAVKDGIIIQLSAHMLPLLQALSQSLIDAAKNSKVVETVSGAMKATFDVMARAVLLVADNMGVLVRIGAVFIGASLAGVAISTALAFAKLAYAVYTTGVAMTIFNAIRSTTTKGLLLVAGLVALAAGAFEGFSDKIKSIGTSIQNMLPEGAGKDLFDMLSGLGVNVRALTADLSTMGAKAPEGAKGLKDISLAALGGKNAIDQFIDSQKKSLEATAAEVATFGMLPGAMEAAKAQFQALAIAKANDTTISTAQQAQLDLTKQKLIENAQALAGLQIVQSNLAPAQLLQQEQFKIQALFDNGKLSAEQYATAMEGAAERAGATWANAGASMSGGFAELANAFSKSNKEMAVAGKAFGIVQATINTYTAFTKALASAPPPLNYALAAGVLAAGMAKVMAISSQSTAGLAMGGAFRVPGGIGGGDRVPFNAMLEPGELVEISSNRPDGYQAGGRGSRPTSGGVYELRIDAILRPFAEMLMPHMEAANRDGHSLKLVTI